MIRLLGVLLVVVALVTAALGVYGLLREDVQGGANEAGIFLLVGAAAIAAVAGLFLRLGRRWHR